MCKKIKTMWSNACATGLLGSEEMSKKTGLLTILQVHYDLDKLKIILLFVDMTEHPWRGPFQLEDLAPAWSYLWLLCSIKSFFLITYSVETPLPFTVSSPCSISFFCKNITIIMIIIKWVSSQESFVFISATSLEQRVRK